MQGAGAVAQATYPLYCQGPLTGNGIKARSSGRKRVLARKIPAQGNARGLIAARGVRKSRPVSPPGNVICLPGKNTVGLNWFALKAGQFYEWCAFRDQNNDNCINVSPTVLGTMMVEPPFLPEPVCAK